MEITIHKKTEEEYIVEVDPDSGFSTEHRVILYPQYYQLITQGKITQEQLIEYSFEFLLERESNNAILSEFDLPDISRYFPEYEAYISERIESEHD